jgi:hypothetical protein
MGWLHDGALQVTCRASISVESFSFKVGDIVQVKPSVTMPTYNWGEVKRGDCGQVSQLVSREKILVNFPNHASWMAKPAEMDLVQAVARSSDHPDLFRRSLKGFLESEDWADLRIAIAGSVVIRAHSVVLASSCSFFKAMLTSAFVEGKAREISLNLQMRWT